jgi:hypothetical protein
MVEPIPEAHLLEQRFRPLRCLAIGQVVGRIRERHHHVFKGARAGQQVEGLEHEADAVHSQHCPLVGRQLSHLPPI